MCVLVFMKIYPIVVKTFVIINIEILKYSGPNVVEINGFTLAKV